MLTIKPESRYFNLLLLISIIGRVEHLLDDGCGSDIGVTASGSAS